MRQLSDEDTYRVPRAAKRAGLVLRSCIPESLSQTSCDDEMLTFCQVLPSALIPRFVFVLLQRWGYVILPVRMDVLDSIEAILN